MQAEEILFGWERLSEDLRLVGHCVHNPEDIHRVRAAGVTRELLVDEMALKAWDAFHECERSGSGVSFDAVGLVIRDRNGPKDFVEWLQLSAELPVATVLQYHLENFLKVAAKREAYRIVKENPDMDPVDRAKEIHQRMHQVTSGLEPEKTLADVTEKWIQLKEEAIAGKGGIIPTHIPGLNQYIRGTAPGRLYVAGARPGVGKTSIAINIAHNLIMRSSRVIFATIEMPAEEILGRFISLQSRVPEDIECPSELQLDRLMKATREINQTKLEIWDDWKGRWDRLESRLTLACKDRVKPDLVVMDHLHIMKFDGKTRDAFVNISEITGAVKRFALEHRVPMMLLSQFNRNLEGSEKKRLPKCSDLRGSGSIEQDADVVMLLHYDEDKGYCMVLDKNRQGKGKQIIPLSVRLEIGEIKGVE